MQHNHQTSIPIEFIKDKCDGWQRGGVDHYTLYTEHLSYFEGCPSDFAQGVHYPLSIGLGQERRVQQGTLWERHGRVYYGITMKERSKHSVKQTKVWIHEQDRSNYTITWEILYIITFNGEPSHIERNFKSVQIQHNASLAVNRTTYHAASSSQGMFQRCLEEPTVEVGSLHTLRLESFSTTPQISC